MNVERNIIEMDINWIISILDNEEYEYNNVNNEHWYDNKPYYNNFSMESQQHNNNNNNNNNNNHDNYDEFYPRQ